MVNGKLYLEARPRQRYKYAFFIILVAFINGITQFRIFVKQPLNGSSFHKSANTAANVCVLVVYTQDKTTV